MHAIGFDAMAVGNHEFDLTPFALQQSFDSAFVGGGFPLLSANLILANDSLAGLRNYIFPYTTKQVGNLKVGIFGMTTPATMLLSRPAPAIVDTNIVQIAADMVDTLSNQNCDVIILLSHLGFYLDQLIAGYVPGINVIVGGHDHYLLDTPVEVTNPMGQPTWLVQVGSVYSTVGKLQLSVDGGQVNMLGFQAIPLDNTIPEEPTIAATVSYLISEIEAIYGPVYSQQVTYCAETFEEVADSLMFAGSKDTPIGNFVTDAYRMTFGTDIAIQAGGSTAQPLYVGPLVGADFFRTVGYGFNLDNGLGYRMATLNMTGADLLAGLEFGLSEIELSDEYLIQVSGMRYAFDSQNNPYVRLVLDSILIGSITIDPYGTYTVTANEFVPMFLDAIGISYSNLHVFSDTTEFEILVGYASQFDTLYPYTEGRISNYLTVGIVGNNNVPDKFILEQNYPNPFNPETKIPFVLSKRSHVVLEIYDILGKKVKTLFSGQMPSGDHKLLWNGRNNSGYQASSGTYFYRLKVGDKQLIR
ncbi:MAG: T9SS type A sorting domain-containing protein, partial [Gammaproteobacteria bacterium]|nr:T9SS type A sorting domain-containing protein [Gammaproteobacteria bacterium]